MSKQIVSIRKRVLNREILSGTFLNLGSHITAEIAGDAGHDWVLLDLEHGAGDHETLVHQMQAVGSTPAAPVVRIPSNEPWRFKRIFDLGASGVMVPWIRSADEAKSVISSMRYPPDGIRGVASSVRAGGYGLTFSDYFAANTELLVTLLQIERQEAVDEAREIAALDGADVLFIGPMDLSVSLGCRGDFKHPTQREAYARVVEAARNAGKAAGILLQSNDQIEEAVDLGFTMIAVGADGAYVAQGMRDAAAAFKRFR